MYIMALLAAAVSGIAMAIQGSLNTDLGKSIGLLAGTFVVQIIGTVFAFLLLILGLDKSHWNMLDTVPWYSFLGGVIGVGIVYGVVYSISKVGAAAATTAIIVGQISMAAIVDHFGLFGLEKIPFNMCKGLGVILMAVSGWLLLRK